MPKRGMEHYLSIWGAPDRKEGVVWSEAYWSESILREDDDPVLVVEPAHDEDVSIHGTIMLYDEDAEAFIEGFVHTEGQRRDLEEGYSIELNLDPMVYRQWSDA